MTEKNSRFSLEGERALITGGGTGIGFGIAECMVRAGAHVVLAGRREELLRTAAEKLGGSAGYLAGDVTDTRGAEEFARTVEERFGPVSILVNNAGIHHKQPFLETAFEDFDKVLRTHVSGSFVMSKAFAPGMAARKHGHILFIASMTTFIGMPRVIGYTAAKSAVGGMVRALTAELAPLGVRVNAISAGPVRTVAARSIPGFMKMYDRVAQVAPLKRNITQEEVGNLGLFLLSPLASGITGEVVYVDAGYHIMGMELE